MYLFQQISIILILFCSKAFAVNCGNLLSEIEEITVGETSLSVLKRYQNKQIQNITQYIKQGRDLDISLSYIDLIFKKQDKEKYLNQLEFCFKNRSSPTNFKSCLANFLKSNGNIPDKILKSLENYFGHGYEMINFYLRTGDRESKEILNSIKDIDSFINSYRSSIPLTLYRRTNLPRSISGGVKSAFLKGKKVLLDKAYMSASLDQRATDFFGDDLHVFVTQNYASASVLSSFTESERIIERGLEWEVVELTNMDEICKKINLKAVRNFIVRIFHDREVAPRVNYGKSFSQAYCH